MDRWKKSLALVSITALVVLTLLGGIVSAMAGEGKTGPGEEQAVTEEIGSIVSEIPAEEPAEETAEEPALEEPAAEAPAAEEAPAVEEEVPAEKAPAAESAPPSDGLDGQCCPRKSKICVIKFLDENENGNKDCGEEGMAGVTILLNGENPKLTGEDGKVCYDNLDAGTYTVSEIIPEGYFATTPDSYTIELCWNQTVTVFFGNAPVQIIPGSISGTKWEDLDGDGVLDDGEPPLEGVTIELLQDDVVIATTTTAADGSYSFTDLEPGDYTVKEIVPAGMTATSPVSVEVAVAEGQDVTDVDFLNHEEEPECDNGVVEVLVWADCNNNGVMDAGEQLLDGVTASLYHVTPSGWIPADGYDGPYQKQTGPGAYGMLAPFGIFMPPYPGGWAGWMNLPRDYSGLGWSEYAVEIDVPEGYYAPMGTVRDGLYLRCPLPCWWKQVEIPLKPYVSIEGNKWEDCDHDGQADGPVEGVTIELWKDGGLVDSTTTAADGSYSFTDLEAGIYTVKEVLPEGWHAVDPASGMYEDIELLCGESIEDIDFINARYLSIEGNKWEDLNCNSEHDEEEPPVEGVTIELWKDGGLVDSTTTAADGAYSFTDLIPGTYTVKEVLPEGWYPKNPDDGIYEDIVLVCGQPIESLDFINSRYSSICGIKFLDENENGIMDEGEEGMDGVLILLNDGEESAVTADGGKFCFEGLLPGMYLVSVDESTAPGYYPTTPTSIEVDLGCGEKKEVFFGNAPYGSISGTKWLDANTDGIWGEDETVVIQDITIKLYEGDPPGDLIATTTTDENGDYSFTDLKPGTYTVVEEGGEGYFSCTPDSVVVNLSGGEGAVVDFGNCPYGRVEGLKFLDLDGDGIQDPNEPGLEGVNVTLSGDGAMAMTTTGEDGTFVFNQLLPGEYTVAEQVPEGYYATRPISVDVIVEPGESVTVIFANALYGSISGTKYIDTNGNGFYDDGEPAYEDGLTITLYGETLGGDIVSAEVTTDANGSYTFTLLEAGDYTVSEVLPENMTATSDVSVDVELAPGDEIIDIDFFNAITDVGGEVVTPPAGGTLPYTGLEQLPLLIAAGILMLLGLAILMVGFRRRFQE